MSDGPCEHCGREALTVEVVSANGKALPPGCRVAINQKQLDEILASVDAPALRKELETARWLLERCAAALGPCPLQREAFAFLAPATPETAPPGRETP